MANSANDPDTITTGDVANITDAPIRGANGDRPVDRFKKYMHNRAAIEGANMAYDVAANQIDKIMQAADSGDVQAIWDADDMPILNGQDLQDVEQRITGFTVHESTNDAFENPWGIFIIVQAQKLSDGEEIVWNTGAALLISKLRAFEAVGAFPLDAVIKGTKAGKGTVLKLAPVPVRAVAG